MNSADAARAVCQLYRRAATFGPYTLHDDEDRVSCLALHNYAIAKSGKPVELLSDQIVHVYLAKCDFRHGGHTMFLCDCVDMSQSVRFLRGLPFRTTTRAGPPNEPITSFDIDACVLITPEKQRLIGDL
jgi:hypothetical protein